MSNWCTTAASVRTISWSANWRPRQERAPVPNGTAANANAIAEALGGLKPRGELVVIGGSREPLPISPVQLISPALSITGHPAGTAADIEDTMNFAVLKGIRAQTQELPLEEAPKAYSAMETDTPDTGWSSPCERRRPGILRTRSEPKLMKIAILDDYQNVALTMADWSLIESNAVVTVFTDHVSEPDAVVARLQPFAVLAAMQGRPPLRRN